MKMRIDPTSSGNIGGTQNTGHTQGAGGAQGTHGSQTVSDRDQVDLSGASNLIALSAGTVSASRQAKIDALATQVQSGRYQVNPGQVAQAIVNNMLRA